MDLGLLKSLRALGDPLRSGAAAERWIAALPTEDAHAVRRKAVEVVGRFPATFPQVGPAQVEALLKVDARLEPTVGELTRDYAIHYDKSADVELALWQQMFDLVKAFIAAYQAALRAGYPRVEDRRWRAVLPWVLVRLAYYRGLDGRFRLFRFSRWAPAQWREFHELYELARTRGWQREQLVLGPATFSRPGVCFEQEYLQTLLLMRLDSGNFTADQVQWIAQQLEDWTPSLSLVASPGDGASFFVDLSGSQGLRRHDQPPEEGRVLFLDVGPVYTRIVERTRWLPEAGAGEPDERVRPGELPVREQRLLLVRLAALFGPDTLAIAPRAARYAVDAEVRVVFGLDALCYAIGEAEHAAASAAPAAGAGATNDDVAAAGSVDLPPSRIGGEVWTMADASETGCRLTTQMAASPARLGDLVGVRSNGAWSLGVVRRIQRSENDDVALGVEVIARRLVPVLLRTWSGGDGGDARPGGGRPFLGIYLPAHPDNRQATQRGLIGPTERLAPAGMVEFDTGKARYLIRFSQVIEHQAAWSWALFSAVRSL